MRVYWPIALIMHNVVSYLYPKNWCRKIPEQFDIRKFPLAALERQQGSNQSRPTDPAIKFIFDVSIGDLMLSVQSCFFVYD